MPTLDVDFDQLVQGRADRGFLLAGRRYLLPPELPHQAMLYLDALQAEGGPGQELGWSQLCSLAGHIWTPQQVEEWLAAGVGLERLSAVVEWAVGELAPRSPGADLGAPAQEPGGQDP